MKKLFLLLAVTGFASACTKDEGPTNLFNYPGAGVFVTNEGTFEQEEASLTYYDLGTGWTEQEICYRANNLPLGDVCQSMTIVGKKGFVVVTNSSRIAVIDTDNFKYIGEIRGAAGDDRISSPRYVLWVSDDKLYVSNKGSDKIAIVNPNSYTVTSSIPLGGGDHVTAPINTSEQMIKYGNYVFVCSYNYNNKVFKIDLATNQVISTLESPYQQPESIAVDPEGYLWILYDGGYWPMEGVTPPFFTTPSKRALIRVPAEGFDYVNATIFEFPSANVTDIQVSDLKIKDNTLYYYYRDWSGETKAGVYAMNITETSLPELPLITDTAGSFYGLGIDPGNGDIYVGHALYGSGYAPVNGKVSRYGSDGSLIGDFPAGIFPGGFCFKP